MNTPLSERMVREDLMRRVRTEGVTVAYETAVGICRDPKAPAPAKATALTALFRVGGYFEKTDSVDAKEPHEMTSAELNASIEKLGRHITALRDEQVGEPEDIFG